MRARNRTPGNRDLFDELIVDSFAGGGGAVSRLTRQIRQRASEKARYERVVKLLRQLGCHTWGNEALNHVNLEVSS